MQSKSLTFANKYFFAYKPSIKFVGKRTPEFWAAQHSGQSAGIPESNAPDFNIAAVRVLGYSEFEVESINSGGIENFDWKKVKPLSASGR